MKYARFNYQNETLVIVFKTRLSRALSGKESLSPSKAKRYIKGGSKIISA